MFNKRIKNNSNKNVVFGNDVLGPKEIRDFAAEEINLYLADTTLFDDGTLVFVDTVETKVDSIIRKNTVETNDVADKSITKEKLADEVIDLISTGGTSVSLTNYYTKTETDAKLTTKADNTSLSNYRNTADKIVSTDLDPILTSKINSISAPYDDSIIKNQLTAAQTDINNIKSALDDNSDGSIIDTISNIKTQWQAADANLQTLINNKVNTTDLTNYRKVADKITSTDLDSTLTSKLSGNILKTDGSVTMDSTYTPSVDAAIATKKYVDTKIATIPTNTGDMSKSVYDTNNNGKVDAADSVDWSGVQNKPVIPTKTSQLTKDDVYTTAQVDTKLTSYAKLTDLYTDLGFYYTKTEVDSKIAAIPGGTGTGTGDMLKSVYDTNNNGKVDAAETADSIDWSGVQNKPALATVATSGNYTDLINTPTIPTKTSDLSKDDVYTRTEVDTKIASISTGTGTGDMLQSIYDTNNNGKVDAAETADSIDWSGVQNKPTIPTKTSELAKDDIYTKTEVDTKIASISTGTGTGDMLQSVYDTNNNGKVDVAERADSIDWTGIQNKPVLATVATSGNYTDLINKPVIPTKTSDLAKDDVYTMTEVDTKIAAKGDMSKSVYDTNNNGKVDVADSVDWSGVQNKPVIPTKTSELAKDDVYTTNEVYTKTEVDTKIAAIPSGGDSGSMYRYEAVGSVNGDCLVRATGTGVSITKSANNMTVTCPAGVIICSLVVRFTAAEMGTNGSCKIDFGMNGGAGVNTDYSTEFVPQFQVFNDVAGSRAYRSAAAGNLNTNSHTLEITNLAVSTGVIINLSF